MVKFNVSYPATGAQKCIDIDDEKKIRLLHDKRLSQEFDGEILGEQFKGYIFKITGGTDKEGFPMKHGVMTNTRVRVLLKEGSDCFHPWRRSGERRRKSVRGCIIGPELSSLNIVVLKKGSEEIPGVTDKYLPKRLGPKRASKIRRLFNLSQKDDVRKYVIKREVASKKEGKKPKLKGPQIQRLLTPVALQRKRHEIAVKRRRQERAKTDAAAYARLLAQRAKDRRERRKSVVSKRRQSSSAPAATTTTASTTTATTATTTTTAQPKVKAAVQPAKTSQQPAQKNTQTQPAPKTTQAAPKNTQTAASTKKAGKK